MNPNYLIIGNVTKDIIPDGAILGGTASYSAVAAHKLAKQVGLVTRVGPDIPSLDVLDGIQTEAILHTHSTTFENIYENGRRRQMLWDFSGQLTLDHVPTAWRNAPIVHLAPIAQDYSPSLSKHFGNSLICVTIQGWLRAQDDQCNVIFQPHADLEAWLPKIDVLVMSRADVFGDETLLNRYLTLVKLGVETIGPEGCVIYHNSEKTHVAVKPAEEVDPTGAGDIFAAAFFIKYHETKDAVQAAQFANACASMSVGRIGVLGTPTLAEVEARVVEMY